MQRIVIRLAHRVKVKLRRLRRETRDKGLATRCQIVLLVAKDRRRADVADALGCSISWVNRVVARHDACGVAGLYDRREDNGTVKVDQWFLATLHGLVDDGPRDHGFPRPTWTRELLVSVMFNQTGVGVHPATMSRGHSRPSGRGWADRRPTVGRPSADRRLPVGCPSAARRLPVGCPWPKRRRNKRSAEVRGVLDALPEGHAAVSPRRGGRAPEPEGRPRLDEPRHAEAGADAGQE